MSRTATYFQSISLQNVKSFGKIEQTLSFVSKEEALAQWTLILGDNGLGKTTILQTLTELCADLNGKSEIDPDSQTEFFQPRGASTYFSRDLYSKYTRVSLTPRKNPIAIPLDKLKDSPASSHIRANLISGIDFNKKLVLKKNRYCDVSLQFLSSNTVAFTQIEEAFSTLQPFAYGTFRRFGPTKFDAEINPNPCVSLFDENQPLLNVEEWLLRADYAAAKSRGSRAKNKLEKIKALLINFLPEITEIRIQASGTKLPIPEAKTPDGWVPVRDLSTGYRATMAWVTDFAARMLELYPEHENPFAEAAVVLVDQIDTHLHPKWQRQLIEKLTQTFPATQFIVTAHSPSMAQALPTSNLIVLRREEDHVIIHDHPDEIKGWRLDQIISSELFEEQPTRDDETEIKLEIRRTLLKKAKLTKSEKSDLVELNKWASTLPTADSPDDIRAMEIIRNAARTLENKK